MQWESSWHWFAHHHSLEREIRGTDVFSLLNGEETGYVRLGLSHMDILVSKQHDKNYVHYS